MSLDTEAHALYRQEILAYGQTPSPEVLQQNNARLHKEVEFLTWELEDLEQATEQALSNCTCG